MQYGTASRARLARKRKIAHSCRCGGAGNGRVTGLRQGMARAAAALMPLGVVLLTPWLAGWQSVLPGLYVPGGDAGASGSVLTSLTGQLSSLAVAVIVAAVVIVREPNASRGQQWLAGLVVAAAGSSLYAGYRFQLGLAEQLAVYRLNLDRLHDRLDWQGLMLLIAVSALFLQGALWLETRRAAAS